MSKSLGNSPDPLDLIAQYGADGVRVGMLLSSPAGNDLLFDEGSCKQGSMFSHKLWNAFRLVKGWEIDATKTQSEASKTACNWFENRFNEEVANITDLYSKYRISEVLMSVYKLAWDDFCSWYLEMVKPPFGEGIDQATYDKTIELFEGLLKVLHPFMPFITEDIWHTLKDRGENDFIIVSEYPKIIKADAAVTADFGVFEKMVTGVRNIRKEKNLSPKMELRMDIKGDVNQLPTPWFDLTYKLCNLSNIGWIAEPLFGHPFFTAGSFECYVPIIMLDGNVEEEIKKLTADLDYTKGFLKSVQAKLANERFVANAKPEAVEGERKKEADANAKIKLLEEQIGALK
jgi:valyl-tRNA synthetase